MSRIYLIPGLGADCRIYKNIDLSGHDVTFVNWIEPDVTDTLTSYAQKLVNKYNIYPNSILIGNSMGGMVAIEIANIIPTSKTILISSIKSCNEASAYFSFFRLVPLYKLIPAKLFTSMGGLVRIVFGKMQPDDQSLFQDMLKNTSPTFVKWAIGAILNWKNTTIPANVYHIAGSSDMLFDCRKATGSQIIEKGTHIMIFDRAEEINRILKKILT
ncbi:alpha/beta hydrolase [Mucilaginibacter sp. UR6-1]|uniref:alpha/beta hydrolase n=1 Tax=Mucilaginibacter sp. UR6-1 TaxID=1435643 RepID=UPI001E511011|nr:alpha/beta hydrolase [Mucilaginibacter sp. UR6-1]MCC8408053.1 alpha/beta hydrolase [Mucilaginibacter sp. UR6-1]